MMAPRWLVLGLVVAPLAAAPALSQQKPQDGKPNKGAAPPAKSPFEVPPVEKDAALVKTINEAIQRGEQWLVENQGKGGSWQKEEAGVRIGYTELALYALSSSAEKLAPGDGNGKAPAGKGPGAPGKAQKPNAAEEHARAVTAAVAKGFAFAKETPARETYALSLLLLALDAANAPRWERDLLAKMSESARLAYKYPRRLTDADRQWIEQSVEELVTHRFKGLWSYVKNPGLGDVSNTQFALLGLRAAARCGAPVDPSVWEETLDYFLKYQDKEGPPVTFPVPRSVPTPGKPIEVVGIEAKQRCWGYSFSTGGGSPDPKKKPPKQKNVPVAGFSMGASGTHASIGVASLQIVRDELARTVAARHDPQLSERLKRETPAIDHGIRDGIGWLAGHWTLEEDPGGGFPFYYLYSIERVGALLGDRFVAGHDWYREGAEILLRRQLPVGAWPSDTGEVNAIGSPDVVATSFALLFLRRATMPGVITPDFRDAR
jgi:hypothetical protein